jgi:hypothetical protein
VDSIAVRARGRDPAGRGPRPHEERMSVFATHRGSVNSWECDENEHLNVRFFVRELASREPITKEERP